MSTVFYTSYFSVDDDAAVAVVSCYGHNVACTNNKTTFLWRDCDAVSSASKSDPSAMAMIELNCCRLKLYENSQWKDVFKADYAYGCVT